ncbi:MAG: AAA family ATPase [Myxococcota bacterium]|jgi:AAA+ superfamily predicted ATPase
MDLKGAVEELGTHYRAHYPLVWLVSHEEVRSVAAAGDLAAAAGVAMTEWPREGGPDGPMELLEAISQELGPSVFALKDFHQHLTSPAVVRRLRDLLPTMTQRKQMAVIISPLLFIPIELEKEAAIVDLPLPDDHELLAIFNRVMVERAALFPDDFIRMSVRAARGLTADEAYRAFCRALIRGGDFELDDIDTIVEEKRRAIRRYEVLEFVENGTGVGAIGGLSELKKWLALREPAFSEEAREFGLPAPKGLLLCGVQGCGKSLTARAVADLWKLPLLRLELGALFSSGITPEEALRRSIKVSTALAPSVLWIDEIEKGFHGVSGGAGKDSPASRAFGMFITWMQEKKEPVFVVATANEVADLPPELIRKGRFDEIFFVDLPDEHEREEIFAIHLRARNRDPAGYRMPELARLAQFFSGAEIEQVVIAGLYRAFGEKRELSQADLERSVVETVPLYRTYEEKIKDLREWAKERARKATSQSKVLDYFGG